jgi:LCP family protein required for cell wall assembly
MRRRSVTRPMSRLRRAVLAGTALVCALVLGCTGLFAAWLAGVRMPIASGATYLRVEKISPLTAANRIAGAPSAPFFILLVGNDFRPGVTGSRGDALHLLGVNPKLKQASMLNIPRDTCWQGDKINAANTRGARASADAVSGLIGVPVSYVVQVNFDGFTNLVDGVGGVDVSVKTQMHDEFSGAFFSPGAYHMTGDQALRFARDRHDFPNSDITRTANQGTLILDAMRMLGKNMQSASGEFRLLALLGRHAQLDGIGIKDLYRLGRLAFSLNPDQIKSITIPITNGTCLGLGGGAASLFADFADDGVVESH